MATGAFRGLRRRPMPRKKRKRQYLISRQSGGTSGNLTVEGRKTKTPVARTTPPSVAVPYAPTRKGKEAEERDIREGAPDRTPTDLAPSSSQARSQAPKARSRATNAARRQQRLVDRFVTRAYDEKVSKMDRSQVPAFEIGSRVEKAKSEVEGLRKRLLAHPTVEKANAEGKVVAPKGLAKIKRREQEDHPSKLLARGGAAFAIEPPGPQRASRERKEERFVKEKLVPLLPGYGKRSAPKTATLSAKGNTTGEAWSPGDPLALAVEKDVIEPAKQAGVLPKSKTTGQKIYQRIAEYGPAVITLAPEVAAGAKALNVGLRGVQVGGERIGAGALSRALTKPAATIDNQAAKSAVAASKAKPASEGIKRIAEIATRAGSRSERALARGLTGTQTRREAAHAGGLPLLGMKAGTPQGSALIEGQLAALKEDPGEVLSKTASLAPSLLTSAAMFPVALGTTAGRAALTNVGLKRYSPSEIAAPTTGAVKAQGDFVKHFSETFLSGDAEKVKEATLKEGLLPEVLLAPLGLKVGGAAYKPIREASRAAVAKRRAPLLGTEGKVALHEHGGPIKRGTQRFPQQGSKPAPISRRGEGNQMRREEAFHAASVSDKAAIEIARRRESVDIYARKAAGERTVVREGLGKKGKDKLEQRAPDYIAFLARAGVDLGNPDAALREIRHYEALYSGLEHPTKYGVNPEALTARDAVKYFSEHPEKLSDENLAQAVETFRAQQNGETGFKSLGFSKRNQYLAYAVAHDKGLPESEVPHAARSLTKATDREGAWQDLKGRQKQAASLRKEGRKRYDQAQAFPKNSERAMLLRAEGKAKYDEARVINKGAKELHSALKPYTRPGAKADAHSKRMAYDKRMEDEWAERMKRDMEADGLHPEPAYVPDQAAVGRAKADESVTGGQKPLPGAPQINTGYVWKHGLSRQGYEWLMNEGVARQVVRGYQFEDFRRFRHDRGIEFEGKFQHNGKDWERAFAQGVISRKDVTLVPTQIVNRLEKATKGGDATDFESALAEAQAARKLSADDMKTGTIYEAFPKAAYAEKVAQAGASNVPAWIRKGNRYTAQAMLSTPAFVGAQVVAEGLQALAEVNPIRQAQGFRAYRKLDAESKARISGGAGETAKAIFTPEDLQTTLGSYDTKPFKDSLSWYRRNAFGRVAHDVLLQRAAGQLNRMTGSKTRRAALTGMVMQDLKGFNAKARKLLGIQTELQKRLDGKTPEQALTYVAENPRILDRYEKQLHDAMGGWNNLTRTGLIPETTRSAALVFYSFLRMSLQWPLKYAENHPIKATALAYLAAQNNWALREAMKGDPSFLNYAQIPVYGVGEDGKSKIIDMRRVSPGGNILVQALQGSGSVIGALQPVPTAIFEGATGQGPLGEISGGVPEHLKAAGASLLGLSPWLRAADTLKGQKKSGQTELGVLAERANLAVEPLSALWSKLKGSKESQLVRSLGFPFLPLDASDESEKAKVGRILESLGANGSDAQSAVPVDATSRESLEQARETVLGMQKRYDKARDELDAIYNKHGLAKVNKRSQEIYEYTHPYPGTEEGKSSIYDKGSIYETGGIYGDKKEKPPGPFPFKGDPGIDFGGIDLPNVSGPLGLLSTLIGGEKAQAATKGKGQKLKAKVPRIEGITHGGEAKEFAQYLSKYTGLDPQFVGAWVQSEGGGYAAGGEAGKNNWLGVGYPGEPTPFGRSSYFSGSPKKAAKATADWIKGTLEGVPGYEYSAAQGIREIISKAAGKGPEAALQALSESGWGTDTSAVATNLGMIQAQGKTMARSVKPRRIPSVVRIGKIAQNRFGLHVSENPAFDQVDPVHTSGSYHYQRDKKGRGEAIDVSGDSAAMLKFDKFVAKKWGAGVTELFYDPGISIKEGQPIGGIGGHGDHVHVAVAQPGAKFTPGGLIGGLGGSSEVAPSGTSFPAGALSSYAEATKSSAKQTFKVARSEPERIMATLQRLNMATGGAFNDLLGVTEGKMSGGSVGPSASELAALGQALQADRRKLLRR